MQIMFIRLMKVSCLLYMMLSSFVAEACEYSNWSACLRAIEVVPVGRSGNVHPIPHSGVKVGNCLAPELDIHYRWTEQIEMELVLETSKHNISGKKALEGTKVGRTWVLPPCLTLKYRFFPCCPIQPYVGVGVNYTHFYSEHCSIRHTNLKLRDSWGAVCQVGVNYQLSEPWFLNFDLKWVQMKTKAKLHGDLNAHVKVDINPLIIGLGIGRRF